MIDTLFRLVLMALLLAVSIIDIKTMTIPDWLNASVGGVCLLFLIYSGGSWLQGLLGALLGGGFLFVADRVSLWVAGKDGFGYGDVKLMTACGLVLGWQGVLIAFWVAFVSGALVGVVILSLRKQKGHATGAYMPFGLFLCVGVWVALVWGEGLVRWWLGV